MLNILFNSPRLFSVKTDLVLWLWYGLELIPVLAGLENVYSVAGQMS